MPETGVLYGRPAPGQTVVCAAALGGPDGGIDRLALLAN